jgi:phosphoribosylglycinamide formyltransferase-1
MSPIRLAVLISGGGTTLQNFIDRIADGFFDASIVQVISSRADAFGVERARRAGLPVSVIKRKECASDGEFSDRVFDQVRRVKADLVCMAGFMHFLPIPDDFLHRVMNIHPSLLPAFGGKGMYGHHVHEAVLAYGAKVSGCTVHFTDNEYDHGPIIIQRAIPILEGDTGESLAFRIFEEECEAYPEAIGLFAAGRLRVQDRCVHISSAPTISEPPIPEDR